MSISVEEGIRVKQPSAGGSDAAHDLYVPADLGVRELDGGTLSAPLANVGRLASWASAHGLEVRVGDTGEDGSLTFSFGPKYSAPSVVSAAARAAQCSF